MTENQVTDAISNEDAPAQQLIPQNILTVLNLTTQFIAPFSLLQALLYLTDLI